MISEAFHQHASDFLSPAPRLNTEPLTKLRFKVWISFLMDTLDVPTPGLVGRKIDTWLERNNKRIHRRAQAYVATKTGGEKSFQALIGYIHNTNASVDYHMPWLSYLFSRLLGGNQDLEAALIRLFYDGPGEIWWAFYSPNFIIKHVDKANRVATAEALVDKTPMGGDWVIPGTEGPWFRRPDPLVKGQSSVDILDLSTINPAIGKIVLDEELYSALTPAIRKFVAALSVAISEYDISAAIGALEWSPIEDRQSKRSYLMRNPLDDLSDAALHFRCAWNLLERADICGITYQDFLDVLVRQSWHVAEKAHGKASTDFARLMLMVTGKDLSSGYWRMNPANQWLHYLSHILPNTQEFSWVAFTTNGIIDIRLAANGIENPKSKRRVEYGGRGHPKIDVKVARKMYAEGHSQSSIARHFNCSREAVRQRLLS